MDAEIYELAERVGVTLQTGLLNAIVKDIGEQPGALPMLQYALTELFDKRQGHKLTVEIEKGSAIEVLPLRP